ncbi:hypothetical protein FOL47_010734 [Perkinsus chesapeaki]|uniref:Uncharacterized protein n=1 Tax=Perkinsus chesapeaki TaxID=330153 RepID=A0A7J6MNX6_PERCH|nr:hypothetical protein FOL47_010734 [Perkinsus chesapeaki]
MAENPAEAKAPMMELQPIQSILQDFIKRSDFASFRYEWNRINTTENGDRDDLSTYALREIVSTFDTKLHRVLCTGYILSLTSADTNAAPGASPAHLLQGKPGLILSELGCLLSMCKHVRTSKRYRLPPQGLGVSPISKTLEHEPYYYLAILKHLFEEYPYSEVDSSGQPTLRDPADPVAAREIVTFLLHSGSDHDAAHVHFMHRLLPLVSEMIDLAGPLQSFSSRLDSSDCNSAERLIHASFVFDCPKLFRHMCLHSAKPMSRGVNGGLYNWPLLLNALWTTPDLDVYLFPLLTRMCRGQISVDVTSRLSCDGLGPVFLDQNDVDDNRLLRSMDPSSLEVIRTLFGDSTADILHRRQSLVKAASLPRRPFTEAISVLELDTAGLMAPSTLPNADLVKHKRELQMALPPQVGPEKARYLVHQLFPLIQKLVADCLEDMPEEDSLVMWMIAWLELESDRRAEAQVTAARQSQLFLERGRSRAPDGTNIGVCHSPAFRQRQIHCQVSNGPRDPLPDEVTRQLPLVAGKASYDLWKSSFLFDEDGALVQAAKPWYEVLWERESEGPPRRRRSSLPNLDGSNGIAQAINSVGERITNLMASGKAHVQRLPNWWRKTSVVRRFSTDSTRRERNELDYSDDEEVPQFFSSVGFRRSYSGDMIGPEQTVQRGIWVTEASDVLDSLGRSSSQTSSLRVEEGSPKKLSGSEFGSGPATSRKNSTETNEDSALEEPHLTLPDGLCGNPTSGTLHGLADVEMSRQERKAKRAGIRERNSSKSESSEAAGRVVDPNMFKAVRKSGDVLERAVSVVASESAYSSD